MATTLEERQAIPPAPPVVDTVTNAGDQATPTGIPTPAAVPGGRGRRWTQVRPFRRAARPEQAALPAIACGEGAAGARAEERGNRPRRLASLLRRVPKNAHSYHDPLFGRPDLVENDYHRFRNYPSG
jgi:hypothetical protein